MEIINQVLQGDRLALARVISQMENDTFKGHQLFNKLFPHTGKAQIIGITGPSGVGKSTLVNAMVRDLRKRDAQKRIGIVAVDPTSPFSGGALLGDRVRMRDISTDPNVFVRSMATRGALGGLAHATCAVSLVLDAAGYDPILVETVGAGKAEVEIARLAHTTILVEAPGLGDDVQAIKAGILEIADILVVNKSDRPGADAVVQSLHSMLELGYTAHEDNHYSSANPFWVPLIIKTIATENNGVDELLNAIDQHAQIMHQTGEWQKREVMRMQAWVEQLFQECLMAQWRRANSHKRYQKIIAAVIERKLSPYQAVNRLLKE
jgi:LAO/AO transport system kinase